MDNDTNNENEDTSESKLFSLEEHKKNRLFESTKETSPLASQPQEETGSKPRVYEIHTKNGRPFEAYGVLMVTPVFVAIGDAAGNFKVVVPMESLDYVTNTEDFVEQTTREV